MRAEYVNPFIEGVERLFTNTLQCPVQRGRPSLANHSAGGEDITGLVGLSGPARGTVALSFPMATARNVVGRLLEMEGPQAEENVTDGVAELVNLVAGQAKTRFRRGSGQPIDISLPTVVRGAEHSLDVGGKSAWLDVPFRSELGGFHLRVTFASER